MARMAKIHTPDRSDFPFHDLDLAGQIDNPDILIFFKIQIMLRSRCVKDGKD